MYIYISVLGTYSLFRISTVLNDALMQSDVKNSKLW